MVSHFWPSPQADFSLAPRNAGRSKATKMAMIAMTTKSSIRAKLFRAALHDLIMKLVPIRKFVLMAMTTLKSRARPENRPGAPNQHTNSNLRQP
jgi:hypothetical protein